MVENPAFPAFFPAPRRNHLFPDICPAARTDVLAEKMGYALMVLSDSEHRTLLQGLLTRDTAAPAEIADPQWDEIGRG
jgi:hypothetical protein